MERGPRGLKLGVIGGTFNPIHFGHLRSVEEVYETLGLDRLLFVPAARPPHKAPSPLIEFEHRLAMVRLAISDRSGFYVSDVEEKRTGPSYTVETLHQFHREYGPYPEIFFITGLDAFLEIHTWKEYRRLFELAALVVITRPGNNPERLRSYIENTITPDAQWHAENRIFSAPDIETIYYLPVTGLAISSTDIRKRIADGRSIRYLTPEPVRKYLVTHGLYATRN